MRIDWTSTLVHVQIVLLTAPPTPVPPGAVSGQEVSSTCAFAVITVLAMVIFITPPQP